MCLDGRKIERKIDMENNDRKENFSKIVKKNSIHLSKIPFPVFFYQMLLYSKHINSSIAASHAKYPSIIFLYLKQ